MSQSFKGKVVIVTGATSGIGRVTALQFAKLGARVVAAGRREAEGQSLIQEIKTAGGESVFVRADVTKEADIRAIVDRAMQEYGRLDIAFNNAGVEISGPITEASVEDFRRVFDTNVLSVLLSMKHEIPAMLKSGGGSIVNTSSVAGHIGMPGVSIYIASKHAVEGLTKVAAVEYAAKNIRVNAVAPAAIQTDMMTRFTGGADTEMAKHLTAMHPIGRVGRPEEVANAVIWLASDQASFITGHSLLVDGGLTVP